MTEAEEAALRLGQERTCMRVTSVEHVYDWRAYSETGDRPTHGIYSSIYGDEHGIRVVNIYCGRLVVILPPQMTRNSDWIFVCEHCGIVAFADTEEAEPLDPD